MMKRSLAQTLTRFLLRGQQECIVRVRLSNNVLDLTLVTASFLKGRLLKWLASPRDVVCVPEVRLLFLVLPQRACRIELDSANH